MIMTKLFCLALSVVLLITTLSASAQSEEQQILSASSELCAPDKAALADAPEPVIMSRELTSQNALLVGRPTFITHHELITSYARTQQGAPYPQRTYPHYNTRRNIIIGVVVVAAIVGIIVIATQHD